MTADATYLRGLMSCFGRRILARSLGKFRVIHTTSCTGRQHCVGAGLSKFQLCGHPAYSFGDFFLEASVWIYACRHDSRQRECSFFIAFDQSDES